MREVERSKLLKAVTKGGKIKVQYMSSVVGFLLKRMQVVLVITR